MFEYEIIGLIHLFVELLLIPVIFALCFIVALAIWDTGLAVGEYISGLKRWQDTLTLKQIEWQARRRIERADLVTRIGPMLGLMGTLIPLGPGLAALGEGNLEILTTAMMVAFDTTVMGLLAGVIGFILGRWRRRRYEQMLDSMEAQLRVPL